MRRFISYLAIVTFCFCLASIVPVDAITRQEALERLIFNYVYFDFGSYYSAKNQAWRIDTFEDTDPIPMKLYVSGATIEGIDNYCSNNGKTPRRLSYDHLLADDYNRLRDKYDSDQIIYLVDDPSNLGFIKIAKGIHSAPPPKPYGSTLTDDEYNALWNWPCSGWCGTLTGKHTDSVFCMNEHTGVPYSGGESWMLNETSDHPGMMVYSAHINSETHWEFFTGAQWRSWVSSNTDWFDCHSCICLHSTYYKPKYKRINGKRKRVGYTKKCCRNYWKTRRERRVRFYPSISRGEKWNACELIKSDNYVAKAGQIHWLDRTPPIIKYFTSTDQPTDGYFPNADATDGTKVIRCTSGDYRKLSLKLWDQNVWSDSIQHNVAINPASWTLDPKNSGDGKYHFVKFANNSFTDTTRSGQEPKAVKIPNHIYGNVGYTIYAWDATNNLNPGVSKVEDNAPTNCYGVCAPGTGKRYNYKTGQNLLTDPSTAKPFPFRAPGDLPPTDRPIESPYRQQNNGYINVHDNDRPNLMVSIVNVRDKEKAVKDTSVTYNYCFPAPPQADFQAIWNQTEYQNFKKGLKFTYEDFVATETVYLMPLSQHCHFGETGADSETKTSIFAGSDSSIRSLITSGADQKNSNFRKLLSLEDFNVSDTVKTTGVMNTDTSNIDELRKRNGFGKEVNAFVVMPMEEDVEYEISVWAQDNSRYMKRETFASKPSSTPSEFQGNSITGNVGSGIKELKISCKNGAITEFEPTLSPSIVWSKCVHGPYKVVFRDPSANMANSSSVPDIITLNSQNPSLQVTAKDVAGNERILRLFFQIEDKKARIRTLEERHMR